MTNRERISKVSTYDLLADLNVHIQAPSAGVNVCIYNAFGHTADERVARCKKYNHSCSQCLQEYLNEETR